MLRTIDRYNGNLIQKVSRPDGSLIRYQTVPEGSLGDSAAVTKHDRLIEARNHLGMLPSLHKAAA